MTILPPRGRNNGHGCLVQSPTLLLLLPLPTWLAAAAPLAPSSLLSDVVRCTSPPPVAVSCRDTALLPALDSAFPVGDVRALNTAAAAAPAASPSTPVPPLLTPFPGLAPPGCEEACAAAEFLAARALREALAYAPNSCFRATLCLNDTWARSAQPSRPAFSAASWSYKDRCREEVKQMLLQCTARAERIAEPHLCGT
jgi:hypothetical protein